MIVKEGREYIVNNGITKSLSKIKVYFDNDQNITTEDRTFPIEMVACAKDLAAAE